MFFLSVPSLMITRVFWGGVVIKGSLRRQLGDISEFHDGVFPIQAKV
jgi:hypothetical protein